MPYEASINWLSVIMLNFNTLVINEEIKYVGLPIEKLNSENAVTVGKLLEEIQVKVEGV